MFNKKLLLFSLILVVSSCSKTSTPSTPKNDSDKKISGIEAQVSKPVLINNELAPSDASEKKIEDAVVRLNPNLSPATEEINESLTPSEIVPAVETSNPLRTSEEVKQEESLSEINSEINQKNSYKSSIYFKDENNS